MIPYQRDLPLGSKINWEELTWKIIETEHFNIHYPKGYENIGKLAALYAEEANILLSEKLQHTLLQVIPVFIYPSHGHFQFTNIIPFPIDEGLGGFTEAEKRRVALPFMGNYNQFRHVFNS